MAYWLDWLRYCLWESGIGLVVVLLLVVALAMPIFLERDVTRHAGKGLSAVATITDIRFGVSKYRPGLMAGVVARDERGTIGIESVEANFVAVCKAGDKIKAKRAGADLILEPLPCR